MATISLPPDIHVRDIVSALRLRGYANWDDVGDDDASEFEATQLLGERHFRAQWTLPSAWAMDDITVSDKEIAFADSVDLRSLITWRERF